MSCLPVLCKEDLCILSQLTVHRVQGDTTLLCRLETVETSLALATFSLKSDFLLFSLFLESPATVGVFWTVWVQPTGTHFPLFYVSLYVYACVSVSGRGNNCRWSQTKPRRGYWIAWGWGYRWF